MALFKVKLKTNKLKWVRYLKAVGLKHHLMVGLSLSLLLVISSFSPGLSAASKDVHIMVTNANDSGPGSLRQAILDANAASRTDYYYIDFDGQLEGATITLQSSLPTITNQ